MVSCLVKHSFLLKKSIFCVFLAYAVTLQSL